MFKIEGLDKLQKELSEASKAMKDMGGELGNVSFNPHDPSSIEAAISNINQMIDKKLGSYSRNNIIGPMMEEMKDKYRDALLEKAAAARLKGKD